MSGEASRLLRGLQEMEVSLFRIRIRSTSAAHPPRAKGRRGETEVAEDPVFLLSRIRGSMGGTNLSRKESQQEDEGERIENLWMEWMGE